MDWFQKGGCSMSIGESKTEGIVSAAWKAIEEGYEECCKKYDRVIFHEDRYEEFERLFMEQYRDVKDRFMVDNTVALDSHKQAAILTICCLEANVIEHISDDPNQISIVPQMIAINVALSYMKNCINEVLKDKGINKKIDIYYLPVALACETPYQEIMCRMLYYEQNESDMSFNVLELADRYFLLEYINLLQRGIEPNLLK